MYESENINELRVQYEIPTKNFDGMDFGDGDSRFNCSLKFDSYAIIYCEKEPFTYWDNYLSIIKFDKFLSAKDQMVFVAKIFQPEDTVPFFHQFGNYLNYIDSGTDLLSEIEIIEDTQDIETRKFWPSESYD